MTKMTYEAALAQVQSTPVDPSYLLVNFGYDSRLVIPTQFAAGMLEALLHAEKIKNNYGDPEGIEPLQRDKIDVQVLSAIEYRHIKTCQLLGVTPKEYKEKQEST